MIGLREAHGLRASRGEHRCARLAQRRDDSFANALRTSSDEGALAFELQECAHGCISRDVIFPSSSTKSKCSVIGLPGKVPVSLTSTVVFVPCTEISMGSTVCRYFFLVSAFHRWIAANPLCRRPSSLTVASGAKQSARTSTSPEFSALR